MGQNEMNVIGHAGNLAGRENEDNCSLQRIIEALGSVDVRLGNLEKLVAGMGLAIAERQVEKEWYSTSELADLLDKSDFTVREKWCNQGRIECEKDPDSGKWRIPAREVQRLRNGGGLNMVRLAALGPPYTLVSPRRSRRGLLVNSGSRFRVNLPSLFSLK